MGMKTGRREVGGSEGKVFVKRKRVGKNRAQGSCMPRMAMVSALLLFLDVS